jgi:hypothetical protein
MNSRFFDTNRKRNSFSCKLFGHLWIVLSWERLTAEKWGAQSMMCQRCCKFDWYL